MILIISESHEPSTDYVIDWITYLGYSFYKIIPEDKVSIKKLSLNGFELTINDQDTIRYSDITSCWFRRGFINFIRTDTERHENKSFLKRISHHINRELYAYNEFVHYMLLKKRHIGTHVDFHTNKFIQLEIANELGIIIPKTYFVDRKKQLVRLTEKEELITKASNFVFDFKYKNKSYMTYTEKIESRFLGEVPEHFMLSLCQEHIPKMCDIRVFYLNGGIYSIAILSQELESTKTDFRKYSNTKPNKSIPFMLPDTLEEKITLFMKKVKLVSGSIDFILDRNGNFIFLEVNPVGQFNMVDYPCNYGINKAIVSYLTSTN